MSDRVFKTKDAKDVDVELRFIKPSQKIVSKGDFVYREYFGKSVRAGLMTSAEADKLLKDRGIWSPEREAEAVEIQVNIAQLEESISEPNIVLEDGMKIYKELKTARNDLEAITNIRRSVVDNTAESVAAEMRTQFYASECVVYNSNSRKVFKNLEDFTNRLGEPLALESYRQALIANYESVFGLDLSKAGETDSRDAEDKWFQDLEELKTEEAKSEIAEPEAIEPVEAKVEAPEPTKKKRRARKKKPSSTE